MFNWVERVLVSGLGGFLGWADLVLGFLGIETDGLWFGFRKGFEYWTGSRLGFWGFSVFGPRKWADSEGFEFYNNNNNKNI